MIEIRTARPSNTPASPIRPAPEQSMSLPRQQGPVRSDGRTSDAQLRQQLLKQAALMSGPDFADYKVGPEDLLQISFLGADSLGSEARVSGEGEIRLLLVGDVKVAGLSPVEITRKLTRLYKQGDYLVNPQISVAVKEYRHLRVAVTGAVNKPDYYSLIGPRTLLEVLGMAGGLSDKAGEVVHIMRPKTGSMIRRAKFQEGSTAGADTVLVDLNKLLPGGAVELNIPIQNGDTVFVPFAQSAYVMGAVTRPGGVLLKDNMTVAKSVSRSGGINPIIGSNIATIVRTDKHGNKTTIPVDLGQVTNGRAEDIALVENDIVFVHESGVRRFFFDLKNFLPGGSVSPFVGAF